MRRTAVGDDDRSTMQRLLALVTAVGASSSGASLAELADASGLPKSTVHRIVNRLVDDGLLERTDQGYELGRLLVELGAHVPRDRNLRMRSLPFMLDLYAATKLPVMLAVLDDGKVLYLDTLAGHGSRVPPVAGYRMAPHTTALGKVLVSHTEGEIDRLLRAPLRPRTPYSIVLRSLMERELSCARDEGVAYDREETLLGINCTAAPVIAANGTCVASVAIASPAADALPRLAAAVRTAAVGISRSLADAAPTPHGDEVGLSSDVAIRYALRSAEGAARAARSEAARSEAARSEAARSEHDGGDQQTCFG